MASTPDFDRVVAAQRRPGRESNDGSLDLKELVRLGTLAASSHNTQPWQFQLQERSITILPDFSRRCPVVDPDDSHLFKSLGCAAENIVHAAAAQGHAADVRFDTGAQVLQIHFEPSKTMRSGPLFHAITSRQCTKQPYDGQNLPRQAIAALEAAGRGEGVRPLFLESAPVRDAIIDYVRSGDLIQLSDPGFRRELISWLRFNDVAAIRAGDGLSSKASDQPALPDWLAKPMIRFVLRGPAQAKTDETNIRSSPLISVFVAEQDTPAAWVEAGRAYERFALQATALGIRTAFINQPIEVPQLRPRLNDLLGLRDETALLMIRAGYGPEAPFSLRRPVADVIMMNQPQGRDAREH
jgi:nitroreductase